MSNETGFHLRWLRLTGPDVKPAEAKFTPGLNVVWGASETGKSFIFTCIDYMLGRSRPPKKISELRGYTTAWLALTARNGHKTYVLERDLQGGDFRLHDATDIDWTLSNEKALHSQHDPERSDTISHFLLTLTGVEDAILLMGKTKRKTRPISFRDVTHAILVDEDRIIAELPPVYPTGQYSTSTGELATFSFLISGNDWKGVFTAPDSKLLKATWRGKNELYEQLISELIVKIGDKLLPQGDVTEEITKIDHQIAEVLSRIDESNQLISAQMFSRKAAWNELNEGQTRVAVIAQLKNRFDLLMMHYASDIERLEFVFEGNFLLAQFGTQHCPYCGCLMNEHTALQPHMESPESNIHEASANEIFKILANMRDLEKTLDALAEEERQIDAQIARSRISIAASEGIIQQELEPQLAISKEKLSELVERRGELHSLQESIDRLNYLTAGQRAIGKEPKHSRSSSRATGPTPKPDDDRLKQLAAEIAFILEEWRYILTGDVAFGSDFDLVVDGEPRRNRGKGIRAVLHAAFTLGIMKHCETQGLKHPGLVLLDSPLTSYKESDYQEVSEDIQTGFFEYLLNLPDHQQVIVFENKEPPATILPRIRNIHFSGKIGLNRQGFIPPRNEAPASRASGSTTSKRIRSRPSSNP